MPKININPVVDEGSNDEAIKGIAKGAKAISEMVSPYNIGEELEENVDLNSPAFRVCKTNLPEKTSFWTKLKNVLFYEIKVELTPHQQKVEDEINEFLHQEVTFKKVKDFLFQEIKF